tara:strand:- start:273 stop:887 length:615 start_codon:yes stop_codon:yes gene_type:complete
MAQYSYGADESQSWTKISFEKKLPYSLKLELAQGLRLKDQLSVLNLAFFQASLSYKNSNGLKINIPYRYTIFEDKIKHRLSFGASYQYSFKPISLKYRIKYYRLYENGKSVEKDGETLGDLIRNEFTMKYKSGKKINFYISGELFHLYNTDNNPLDEYRASFGIEIDLSRKNSIDLFYLFKAEGIENSNLNKINIIGFNYISKI